MPRPTATPAPHTPNHPIPLRGEEPTAWLLYGFLGLQALQLGVLPTLLLLRHAAWGWLLLLPVALTPTWWAYVHDCIHGSAFTHRRLNRMAGRANAVLFGAPFDLLRQGHLLHHAYSRSPRESSEVFVPGHGSRLSFTVAYYLRLLGGLYLSEVLGGWLFLLPTRWLHRLAPRLDRPDNVLGPLTERLLQPSTLKAVRQDAVATLLVYAIALVAYGHHAWMLLLALYGRALLVSLMDNVFHYGTALGDARQADNLRLPAWASRLILHFNLHGMHHLRPGIPWYGLPAALAQRGESCPRHLLPALAVQLRGPIEWTALPMRPASTGAASWPCAADLPHLQKADR